MILGPSFETILNNFIAKLLKHFVMVDIWAAGW